MQKNEINAPTKYGAPGRYTGLCGDVKNMNRNVVINGGPTMVVIFTMVVIPA
jgi:hypothetical protein